MTTKHTPGPWTLDVQRDGAEGGTWINIEADAILGLVAEAIGCRADAHLIAAAPDLLEALRYFGEKCQANTDDGEETGWNAALRTARAAIAKAEGRHAP
jgi:hypothetical protein